METAMLALISDPKENRVEGRKPVEISQGKHGKVHWHVICQAHGSACFLGEEGAAENLKKLPPIPESCLIQGTALSGDSHIGN